MEYSIYRISCELLVSMNNFKFNTNYIFIFLCDILKNILEIMKKKLNNILIMKKKKTKKNKNKNKMKNKDQDKDKDKNKNEKGKEEFYDIEEILKDICNLIVLELKQLPHEFQSFLQRIVDDYVYENV